MSEYARKREIQVTTRTDGRREIGLQGSIRSLSAQFPADFALLREPGVLQASVSPPRRKIGAARWFLAQFCACVDHESAALMFFEAYLTELRASTFALLHLLADVPGFNQWYSEQQEAMRADKNLRWLVNARNAAQKQGLVLGNWELSNVVRFHRNGEITAESKLPEMRIEGLQETIAIGDLGSMVDRVSQVIEDAHARFGPASPSRKNKISLDTLREREDGTWEHFDPNANPTIRVVAKKG